MDKLPLHGFLLRPIQRICQYHLQLSELLKQTEVSKEISLVSSLDNRSGQIVFTIIEGVYFLTLCKIGI